VLIAGPTSVTQHIRVAVAVVDRCAASHADVTIVRLRRARRLSLLACVTQQNVRRIRRKPLAATGTGNTAQR